MAKSIEGIPENLLHRTRLNDFKRWMTFLPIDDRAKRNLISTWSSYTGLIFNAQDFIDCQLHLPPRD